MGFDEAVRPRAKIAIFRLREVAKEKWGDRCKAPMLTPTKRGMTTGGKEDDDGLADTLFKDGETHFSASESCISKASGIVQRIACLLL